MNGVLGFLSFFCFLSFACPIIGLPKREREKGGSDNEKRGNQPQEDS